jgi:hypothetical protein
MDPDGRGFFWQGMNGGAGGFAAAGLAFENRYRACFPVKKCHLTPIHAYDPYSCL